MTVALVMCAGGRAANPVAAVESVLGLVDSYTIVDTGIPVEVRSELEDAVKDMRGEMLEEPFTVTTFNRALDRASGTADWLLHLHADETAEVFPTMKEWLEADESPATDVWMVPIVNPGLVHRLPRLMRGNQKWEYVGLAHEYLEIAGKSTRPLNGLELHHHGGPAGPEKFEWVIEQLEPGYLAGEPRATFYTAEALRDLGRIDEAIVVYRERALQGGWEEERWYAEYQAAKLSEDMEGLMHAWRIRPHRHEPLQAAARIVAARGTSDVLFVESVL